MSLKRSCRTQENMKNNKLISKTKPRFKTERHNVFTEEINKMASSSNNDKNAINWFNKNISIWNKERSNIWKRRD